VPDLVQLLFGVSFQVSDFLPQSISLHHF